MNKIEKMHIADIIDETNIYFTLGTLFEIWKNPSKKADNPEEMSALEILAKEDGLLDRLLQNEFELYGFLIEHDNEIDKTKFVVTILKNFKDRLSKLGAIKIDANEQKLIEEGIVGIKKLLKGIDETYVYYNFDRKDERLTHLTILNTAEETGEKTRKKKTANMQRLQALKAKENLINIIQGLTLSDIEDVIANDRKIGEALRYMTEYNTLVSQYGTSMKGLEELSPELAKRVDRRTYAQEVANTLESYIEEINMDKLLLCSAYRYVEGLEEGTIPDELAINVKERLETIKRHIEKNPKISMSKDASYSVKEFEKDLKRFVKTGDDVIFLKEKDIQEFREGVLNGEISLNCLGRERFEVINLDAGTILKLLRDNPDNYIFFLRQGNCKYSKETILRDIIKSQKCSTELLVELCKQTDITAEEICNLFDREIISVSDLKGLKGKVGTIISDETLYGKYKEYKENNKEQDKRSEIERYALAYRNTELTGKNSEELQSKGEEFIANVGDDIESSDLVPLYKFDIIPLKVAVDWGGDSIIEELLESESLKPADARYLRDEGLLDENILERLFKKCSQMSYSYQISLVYTIFDGQTPEEQEIRERLAQYYHIENGLVNSNTKGNKIKQRKSEKEQEVPEKRIKMRDPGAKYNLLSAIDKSVKIEEGIIDGHIIFHYPNIDEGTVLIEKLHKITTNKKNGTIEIKADNQSATYVLSEEEFIKLKSQLLQNGKIDRTQLTQRWWETRDPEHWIPHIGTEFWEKSILERFEINEENTRYSAEDLKKIKELIAKSIESKKIEDR